MTQKSQYTARAVIGLPWLAMRGFVMYRIPEKTTDIFLLHRHTNRFHAMKGLVYRNQTDYFFKKKNSVALFMDGV